MSTSMLDVSHATPNTEEVKKVVQDRYGKCAEKGGGGSCCCAGEATSSLSFAAEHGLYSQEELSLVPKIALSLSKGCGNPTGFANLEPGEVVVDLGCGAGIDVILAAQKVDPGGKVIGADRIAVMAALNMAHDLLEQRSKKDDTTEDLSKRLKTMQEKIAFTLDQRNQLDL